MKKEIEEIKAKSLPVRPSLYAMYYQVLKDVAHQHGYNLCIHGSMNRDFDLVAFPWKSDCTKSLFTVANEMRESIGGQFNEGQGKTCEGGAIWYPINIWRMTPFTDEKDQQYYLDLKIYPYPNSAFSASPLPRDVQERAKEIESEAKNWATDQVFNRDDFREVIMNTFIVAAKSDEAKNYHLAGASSGMQWVKASEGTPPLRVGQTFSEYVPLKMYDNRFLLGRVHESAGKKSFEITSSDGAKTYFSEGSFYQIYWLDESSPSSMQEENERLRGMMDNWLNQASTPDFIREEIEALNKQQ